MKFRTLLLSLALTAATMVDAATPTPAPPIDQQFEQTVRPFVGKYCVACHSGKTAPAQFDLKSYTSVDMVTDDFARWALLAERLKAKEMPPKPMPPPPANEAQQVIDWVAAVRAEEDKEGRRRPRRRAGAPVKQRRVRLYDPRPHRPGHARRQAVSGGSCQPGRFRQFGRIANHVSGASE